METSVYTLLLVGRRPCLKVFSVELWWIENGYKDWPVWPTKVNVLDLTLLEAYS